jgi:hypothetical protein
MPRKIEEERYRAEKERKREVVRARRLVSHCEDLQLACDVRAFIAAVDHVRAIRPLRRQYQTPRSRTQPRKPRVIAEQGELIA